MLDASNSFESDAIVSCLTRHFTVSFTTFCVNYSQLKIMSNKGCFASFAGKNILQNNYIGKILFLNNCFARTLDVINQYKEKLRFTFVQGAQEHGIFLEPKLSVVNMGECFKIMHTQIYTYYMRCERNRCSQTFRVG